MHRLTFLLAAASITIPSSAAHAQGRGNPVLLMPPPGVGVAPEQFFTTYLSLRYDITGTQPIVYVCGEWTRSVTADLQYWLVDFKKVASQIVISESCPTGLDYFDWVKPSPGENELVYITQFTLGPRHSQLYAFARPLQDGKPPFPKGRMEHFHWDHATGVGLETSLTFSLFHLSSH